MKELSDETQTRIAADRLMEDILSGSLAPGHKLRIVELKSAYGIGSSPLREALSMVTSLGYVTNEARRGYRVAEMSREDLTDISKAREIIELGMLRESMAAATDDWEIGIATATERLRRGVAKTTADKIGPSDQVGTLHKQFHIALVAGCTSPRLAATQDLLFDQASRYREIMVSEVRSAQHFFETHEALAKIVLSGDVEHACAALRDHLLITLRDVYPSQL